MSAQFLSDDDLWVCVCAARLAELDREGRSLNQFLSVATDLRCRRELGVLNPVQAAECYARFGPQQVAA